MRNYWTIVTRELKSYFSSPIAYVVIGLFLAISGVFFYLLITSFVQLCMRADVQAQMYRMAPPKLNINMMAIRPLFHNMSMFALFFMPLITMRLYADEKRSGTIELLLTSPVTNLQHILGKFSAAAILYLFMLLFTFVYMLLLFIFGNPELGPIMTGYLGLFLLGLCYIAFGIFFSTLTDNQLIAAISTMVFILFFYVVGWLSGLVGPFLGQFVEKLSVIEYFNDFSKGIFDTQNVIFYLSFIFMGLFLSFISIESARWRGR
ncbi:MAG TPA: ABC transporter permease [bacterium]|jgi:ABC-2 type transport system permease protein|nr:ABC transporter permease [bacterium]HNT66139.1 ABC transporter permease [bacterium]HOX87067.1 ABC transporter permease [bacterium]HPG46398.1 ABC transporter permease [bacterium]HPM98688.1 ABC transporter permease [bacterium]